MPKSKIDVLINNISESARLQRQDIISQAEQRLSEALSRANEQYSFEISEAKKREISDINTKSGISISTAESTARAGLFKRREEIRVEIFKEAEKCIADFTKTSAYKDLLISSAKKIAQKMNGQCAELIIREADKKYAADICAYLGNSITLHIDNHIKLGGIIVKSSDRQMMIDDTLDERLNSQQKWFMENSGLIVE